MRFEGCWKSIKCFDFEFGLKYVLGGKGSFFFCMLGFLMIYCSGNLVNFNIDYVFLIVFLGFFGCFFWVCISDY